MLETAAISVAMGNATDVVKELSDHVTTQLLDDGIWNAMMEYKLIS
jgi:hydroxymethylpyrimidine pyrophosphatase-like HAD family hydrolase